MGATTEVKWANEPSFTPNYELARNLHRGRILEIIERAAKRVRRPSTWYQLARTRLSAPGGPEKFDRRIRSSEKRGDPRRALPQPLLERHGEEVRVSFPHAERAGASREQLEQAAIELELGFTALAKRQAHCGVLAASLHCINEPNHRFLIRYGCGNRYCPYCAHRSFCRLFTKHKKLETLVRRLLAANPDWVVAKLDFTVPNTGAMPTPELIKQFNKDIREFFQALKKRGYILHKGFGAIGCNEFGGKGTTSLSGHGQFRGNTNLHAHYMYVGPRLPQSKNGKELSALWSEIRGERCFVSIKRAKSFFAGLVHALKYAGKFISRDPRRLAQLEQAFFGVRRVHAFELFFKPKLEPDEAEKGTQGTPRCPCCDGLLGDTNAGLRPVADLLALGYRDLELARVEEGRKKIFASRASP
jgi:hypothetical protein